MPGKSRRKRGRQAAARKAQSHRQGPGVGQAGAPGRPGRFIEQGTPPAAAPAVATAPAAGVSPEVATAHQPIRHPYIGAELRTIGILAVLMVVVLIVLKLVIT